LIVNADDFGYSKGVNDGIIKSHRHGIVTSTSIIVNGLAASEAKKLLQYPELSIGLHFNITDEGLKSDIIKRVVLPFRKAKEIEQEFEVQIKRFIEIIGKPPDHLDSHHHVHLQSQVVRHIFKKYSQKNKIPVRGFGNINFIDSFFGRDIFRRTSFKKISVDSLLKILSSLKNGLNELMCHPGLVDADLLKISSYAKERKVELETLTNKKVINCITETKIKLCNWKFARP